MKETQEMGRKRADLRNAQRRPTARNPRKRRRSTGHAKTPSTSRRSARNGDKAIGRVTPPALCCTAIGCQRLCNVTRRVSLCYRERTRLIITSTQRAFLNVLWREDHRTSGTGQCMGVAGDGVGTLRLPRLAQRWGCGYHK